MSDVDAAAGKAAMATERLHDWERALAGIAGILLLAVAVVLVVRPPSVDTVIDGCTAVGEACVVSVASDQSTFAGVLAAVGAAALLVALLGIRFTKLKAGPVDLEAPQATEVAADVPEREAAAGQLEPVAPTWRREDEPGLAAADRFAPEGAPAPAWIWQELPAWARDALWEWAKANPVLEKSPPFALVEAWKPTGRGDTNWMVALDTTNGRRILELGTGGRGTGVPSGR